MLITWMNSRLMQGNEAAFAQGGATVCVLASGGAADCVIIAAYAESIRRAFLVHATRSTDLGQVKALIEKFCTDRTGRTEVYTSSKALRPWLPALVVVTSSFPLLP